MKSCRRIQFFVLIASLCLSVPAWAQTSASHPTSSSVEQQFKSGTDRVGSGAKQIGEGIKQGAIMTWEAIRDGAAAATARFNGGRNASKNNPGQLTRKSP